MAASVAQQQDQRQDQPHQPQRDRKQWQRPLGIAIAVLALSGSSLWVWSRLEQRTNPDLVMPVSTVPATPTVMALGYLEPAGEVIAVSATTSADGNRVQALLVQAGDWVEAGQTLAVLDSRDRLEARLSEAQEQVRVAEANLARVLAGSQTGEIMAQEANVARVRMERQTAIQAQKATITRLKLELANAEQDVQRYDLLFQEGAISDAERDQRQLTRDVVAEQLEEAEAQLAQTQSTLAAQLDAERATLDRIAEVRPVDVAVAEAEVRQAKAAVQRAEADLAQTVIQAPQAGRVLEIYTRPGEAIAPEGIVAIGQTKQMYAVAEVYETDILNVQTGQPAEIISASLPRPLRGTVDRLGWQVQRQQAIDTDPATNIDHKIVKVWVKLDPADNTAAEQLTNLQVEVAIES